MNSVSESELSLWETCECFPLKRGSFNQILNRTPLLLWGGVSNIDQSWSQLSRVFTCIQETRLIHMDKRLWYRILPRLQCAVQIIIFSYIVTSFIFFLFFPPPLPPSILPFLRLSFLWGRQVQPEVTEASLEAGACVQKWGAGCIH